LVFGIFLQHFSQSKIDSALSMLQVDSIHDTTKLRNLYYAADDISLEIPDSANKLLDIGLDYLETSNQIFETDSNNRFTKEFFKREYYNLKGITCFILKRERECLDYWMKAEKIASRVNDTNSLLSIKNNIAIVYSSSGRNKEALDIFKAQKEYYETNKDTANIIKSSLNTAFIMNEMNEEKDSAIQLLNKALELSMVTKNDKDRANIYWQLVTAHLDSNSTNTFNLSLSKSYLDSLFFYATKDNDKENLINYYVLVTEYYYLNKRYKTALINAKRGAELSKQMKGITSTEILSLLYKTFKKLNNYKKANFYLEQNIATKDSLEKLSAKDELIKYESEKKFEIKQQLDSLKHLEEMRFQQAETKAKEEEIKMQRIIEGVLLIGILLVIGFLVFVYKQLNTTKAQKLVIEEKQQEITDSINYAKRIQDAMMTSSGYIIDALPESFIYFNPKDVVSGDFYWAFSDQSGNIFFTVADCTGHGVPGAFMSMIGTSLLNKIIIENKIKETDQILNELRLQIIRALNQKEDSSQKDGMDISLCKLDLKNKTLQFSGAMNPLVHISGDELKIYKGDPQPIGYLSGKEKSFTSEHVRLEKGDMVYVFSDGFQDQFGGEKGKKYRSLKFRKFLHSISYKSTDEQNKLIEQEFNSWLGDYEQIDDVCVMGVRIT